MRVEAATKAARVRQCDLPGRPLRANSRNVFSALATDHVGRARPTAGSDRGFARSNLFRLGRARGDERESFWIAQRFDRKIDVQQRPVKVVFGRALDGRDLLDRSCFKPRKLRVRNRQLFATYEHPEPVGGDVCDFNFQSDDARHFRSPRYAQRRRPALAAPAQVKALCLRPSVPAG